MIPQNEFHMALTCALVAAATPQCPRPDLQGVIFHFLADDQVRVGGTNGHRFTLITLRAKHGQPHGSIFFMGTDDVKRTLGAFPAVAGEVVLAIFNNQMILVAGAAYLTIDEHFVAFPCYESIFEPNPDIYGEACFDLRQVIAMLPTLEPFTERWVSFRVYPSSAGYFRAQVREGFTAICDVAVALSPAARR